MFRKYSAEHIGKTAVDATRDYLRMDAPTSDRAMPAPAEGRIVQVAILGRLLFRKVALSGRSPVSTFLIWQVPDLVVLQLGALCYGAATGVETALTKREVTTSFITFMRPRTLPLPVALLTDRLTPRLLRFRFFTQK